MRVTRHPHTEEAELNMTPMIDIVFLLIIFFLVVSKIASYDRIENLTLPVADEAAPEQELPERLIINVNAFNQIIITGQKRTLEDVARIFRTQKQRRHERGRTKQPVLIQADQNVKWEVVQDIIEMANKFGYWRLSFGAKKEGP